MSLPCFLINYNALIQIENAVFDFAEQTDFITLGDINQDSMIDILDAVLLVNFILGQTTPDNIENICSDLNADGMINIQDVILLINIIIG